MTTHELIRLKRYEEPPKEYFDNFLEDCRLRQRAELLKPTWADRCISVTSRVTTRHINLLILLLLVSSPLVAGILLNGQPTKERGNFTLFEVPEHAIQLAVNKNVKYRHTATHYVLDSLPPVLGTAVMSF